jgi:hypothetical protein
MEDYRSLYHQSILTVRKLILDARYYQNHRAGWETDNSRKKLILAEANLVLAMEMVEKIERMEG